jgi:hypothetical protein
MRMIAPAEGRRARMLRRGSDGPPQPGRGAASSLGAPPFSTIAVPALALGGQAVTSEDLRLIADWIDAGCPAEDHVRASIRSTSPWSAPSAPRRRTSEQ